MDIFFFSFLLSSFLILWAMVGYPASLLILNKIVKKKLVKKKLEYLPSVTLMVVAHNEEKVIMEKLYNILNINYPKKKLKVVISSDNSTDLTNQIVEKFIEHNQLSNFVLYKVNNRMGKTNAQNEAQKIINSEILVMTDANSILKEDCIMVLVKNFSDPSIAYVTGRLEYSNIYTSLTSNSESNYWNLDLMMRKIESNIQTITAGNGALYAVRNSLYFDIPLIHSHDSYFPQYFATHGYRCVFEENAIVYEKAGESNKDEYRRKVRMNRTIIEDSFFHWNYLNIFKYKWFSFFYFGHRKCRYLLWLNHTLLLISNIILSIDSIIFTYILVFHIIVYIVGLSGMFFHKPWLSNMVAYYLMTVIAQIHGVYNCISGKSKPFWEKIESTR